MDTDYVKNPKTGRLIKIGSMTHRKLINEKVIKNTKKNPKIAYKLDEGDDIEAIKRELKSKIKLKKGETLRTGVGKNKGKIMVAFKGGRYKKDESDSDDEFENLCKKLDINESFKPKKPKKSSKKPAKKLKEAPPPSESDEPSSESSSSSESEESE